MAGVATPMLGGEATTRGEGSVGLSDAGEDGSRGAAAAMAPVAAIAVDEQPQQQQQGGGQQQHGPGEPAVQQLLEGEATDEKGRALIELDLVAQIQSLRSKLEEITGGEKDEEALLEDLMEEITAEEAADGRLLVITRQLPVVPFRDAQGKVQWRPTSGSANLSQVITALHTSTKQVVWFGTLEDKTGVPLFQLRWLHEASLWPLSPPMTSLVSALFRALHKH
jgi:hypothetical protein